MRRSILGENFSLFLVYALVFFLGKKMMPEELLVVLPSYRDATIYFRRNFWLFSVSCFVFLARLWCLQMLQKLCERLAYGARCCSAVIPPGDFMPCLSFLASSPVHVHQGKALSSQYNIYIASWHLFTALTPSIIGKDNNLRVISQRFMCNKKKSQEEQRLKKSKQTSERCT